MAFTHRITFTVTSNSALLPATQTDYPLLVSLTNVLLGLESRGNGGKVQNGAPTNKPADLQFFSNSNFTGQLKWDIDYWDAFTGDFIAWVKIPSLALGTVFYCGFGDPAITTYDGDPENVWDSNFKAVHHGSDGTAPGDISLVDSTANNFDGTQGAIAPLIETTGQISLGMESDAATGRNAFISGSDTIVTGQSLTVSGWFAATSAEGGGAIFGKGNITTHDWMIYLLNSGNFGVYAIADTAENVNTGIAWSSTFQYVALVYDGANLTAYVDGTSAGSTPLTGNIVNSANSRVGWSDYLLGTELVTGKMDETRVSATVRSPEWIKIDYENQSDPATFVTATIEAIVAAGGGFPVIGSGVVPVF